MLKLIRDTKPKFKEGTSDEVRKLIACLLTQDQMNRYDIGRKLNYMEFF